MPIITFDSLDLVPDGLKDVAKQVEGSDGKVTVNVVPTAKIDEFRDKNIALSKERDDLASANTTYKSIIGDDPESFVKGYDELKQVQQRVADGTLKETRQIEESLAKRTEELRKDYDSRLKTVGQESAAWQQRYSALDSNFRKSLVESAIKDAAMAPDSGLQPGAVHDVIRFAHEVFKADDQGRVQPFEGEALIYGQDGVTPMSPKEWLGRLKETKGFYFKQSNGGGAGGENSTTKRIMGVDQKKLSSMSPQERLALANAEAARKQSSGN